MRFRIFLLALPLMAQQRVSAPRADGHSTPLLVYAAAGASGCAPLAVISHGAGGSKNGLSYLGTAMAQSGFTAVVMGHRESGLAAARADIRASGQKRAGIQELVADPKAEEARLLDVDAALKWADAQCKAPFRVLMGHSMGSETVMMEAGARNRINIASPPAAQNRFDAYVALSPQGPGIVFADHAWTGIQKPVLVLTGTRDQALKGGPQARLIPWKELPGIASKCQWMGVITDATHMNFAGNGEGADRVKPIVLQTIMSFLKGVRAGGCTVPPVNTAMTLQVK